MKVGDRASSTLWPVTCVIQDISRIKRGPGQHDPRDAALKWTVVFSVTPAVPLAVKPVKYVIHVSEEQLREPASRYVTRLDEELADLNAAYRRARDMRPKSFTILTNILIEDLEHAFIAAHERAALRLGAPS